MLTAQGLFIVISALIVILGVVFYILISQLQSLRKSLKTEENNVLMEWLKEMRTEMKSSAERSSDVLEAQLKSQRQAMNEQTKLIWERLDSAADVIRSVQKQMGGIQEFGNDIKDLSNVLKSPKMRGGLGEQFLYEILENSLPKELFKTQYRFKDGAIADAVIILEKGMIAIDSKFPMENFKNMLTKETQAERDAAKKVFVRDVKTRIDEISSKYILPSEGTTEFAVMYIPSENVFYELIVNTPEIEDYAKAKNVVMTSPNTFHFQVKSLLAAFQQYELAKNVGKILKAISGIKIEAEKFDGDLGVLEGHVSDTYKSMDRVRNKFSKLFGRIEGAQALSEPEEQLKLE